jgi:hypothetical protein
LVFLLTDGKIRFSGESGDCRMKSFFLPTMAAASWLLCLVHFHKEARVSSRSFFLVFHADGNIRVSRELVATAV